MKRALLFALGWVAVAVVAFPLFWMLTSAFKPTPELFARTPTAFPAAPTLLHFRRVFADTAFTTYFANSLIVALASTAVVLLVAVPGAHALVALPLRGRRLIARLVLFTYLLPTTVVLIPIYLMLSRLGLANTLAGLVVAHTALVLPFALWLMRSFMASIPREVEQSAMIDGASRFRAFLDVVLPQAVPGIITTGVFAFILSWNEYLFALVLISDGARKTLPVGVMSSLVTGYNVEWGMVMAVATLMTLPILLIFLALQRHVVGGFSAGAVKG